MKSNHAICNRALQRAAHKHLRTQAQALKRYSVYTLLLVFGLGVAMFKTIELQVAQQLSPQLTYGTGIYTNHQVGGYVTIGVAMFVAGVVFTIVCMKLKEKEE